MGARAGVASLVAVACALGACRERAAEKVDTRLSFRKDGVELRAVALADLTRDIRVETFTAYDPYYKKKKTYRALPLRPVLERGFAGLGAPLEQQEYVLRARDGFTVPLAAARLLEPGAYIAIADVDVPGWEPIGPQQANPGPFYVVWRGDAQQDLDAYPRPWQLSSIEIANPEATFPSTMPRGEPAGSPAMLGFATFRAQCIHCHAMNREGGRVGPDLNVPQSIVEYRPEPQIRAYIRNPATFRYGNMPAHPHLGDAQLDELIAYFRAMKDRKHDPDAGLR